MRPLDITATHDVMTCPACGQTITAAIVIKPTLGKPKLSEGGKVDLSVSADLQRFSIAHHCQGRVEAATADQETDA